MNFFMIEDVKMEKMKMTKCDKCGEEKRVRSYYGGQFQEYFNLCKDCASKKDRENFRKQLEDSSKTGKEKVSK